MIRHDRVAIVAVMVLALPVLLGAAYSLAAAVGLAGTGASGFTLARVIDVLRAPETWRSVWWTVVTASVATVLSTAAAIAIAVTLRRVTVARSIIAIPLSVPHAAGALAVLLLFAQSGLLARLAAAFGLIDAPADFPVLVYDRPGIGVILAFAWKEFPFLSLAALAILETRGSHLEEVARTLGATPYVAFRRVTLPLLARGMAPVVIAVFAFLLGQYEIAALLGPSDPLALPVLMYERLSDPDLGRRGEAHVLGLIALALTVALVAVHGRFADAQDASA